MEIYSNFFFLILIVIFNYFFFSNYKFFGEKLNIFDKNIIKQSKKKVYLIGGVGIFINLILGFIVTKQLDFLSITFLLSSFLFFLFGYLDDKFNLSANLKLIVIAILILILLLNEENLLIKSLYFSTFNYYLSTSLLEIPFTILCFGLYLNAINMYDGLNLQCGLYSIILSTYFFLISSSLFFVILIICLFFFLIFNKKNKIFLGDNGSLLLGFIFSYFFIKFYNLGYIDGVEEIFILMMIPGIDMFRLFCQRIHNKKNPFKKDNQHIHHLLIKRFSIMKTNVIIQGIFLISITLYFNINFITSFLFFIIIYSLILIKRL